MKYDAFISYRHAELDMEIAKKVHTGLETYKIPGAVRNKTGKKKMGRVFRDQEELPIGSDLDDNISGALKESEYLIVICSPRTPESYWVCKEIESFIAMHDRNHVLAVLIEGEPDESFPPQLLVDDEGNPVEPLAADVRGADRRERNKKFRTEILRLAAPVIGCTYDDLKQRHRERILKRTIAMVSAAATVLALAGTAFGLYNADVAAKMKALADEKAALADEKTKLADEKAALADEKTKLADEITVQYQGKQENQSRFYAQEAMSLLRSGNREDAVLVAMEGLPSEGNERPYVPDAEYALSRAVYAYDCATRMTCDRILQHRLTVSEMIVSEDRKKLVVIDAGSRVYVWNVADWKLLSSIAPTIDESNYFVDVESADADDSGICIATAHELIKYDYQGGVIYRKEFEDIVRKIDLCADTGKLVVILKDAFLVLDASDGTILETHECEAGYSFIKKGAYNAEYGLYVAADYESEEKIHHICVYDMEKGTLQNIRLSEDCYLNSCVTVDGNVAVVSCNLVELGGEFTHAMTDYFTPDGRRVWSKELPAHVKNPGLFVTMIKDHQYTKDDGVHQDLVITLEAEAFTYDEKDGNLRTAFTLPGDATALSVNLDSPNGRVGYRQGDFDLVDFSEGRIYSEHTFQTEESIRSWAVLNTQLAYVPPQSAEIHVVSWHEASDIEDHVTFEEKVTPAGVSEDGMLYAVRPDADYQTYLIMNADGTEACRYEGDAFIKGMVLRNKKAYFWDSKGLTILDPGSGKKEQITPSDYGFSDFSVEISLNRGADRCCFWNLRSLMVFDPAGKEVTGEYQTEEMIRGVLLSDDGSRVYVADDQGSISAVDIATGETHGFRDEKMRTVAEGFFKDFMALSPDGSRLALCCADGMLRVADTASCETVLEIPLESYLRSYLTFTDDGSHIVVQGDDYRIRILDLATGAYVTTVDGNGTIEYIACDEESGLMAVSTGVSQYLFETEGYGQVAFAEDGLLYLKSNDSILVSIDRQEISRIYYKDYRKLMEEAQKQFPGAALTEEKKTRYNVG